jgi:uncharacterized membrane protein
MDYYFQEWLNLILRWFHILAGITWIGQTYLFHWFEKRLVPPEDPKQQKNIAGRLWMVHGGGFYLVEKQKVPELMPQTLHWFKWESALTWISGFLLLGVVYYVGRLQVDFDSNFSSALGIGIGLAALILSWPVYELLWRSPLGKSEWVGGAASLLFVLAAAYGLSQVLSPRAVYIHMGAMFGTIMAANVWLRILPAQRQMLAAVKAGEKPDTALAEGAQRCSKHNTYMSVPLIFLMISNHFPATTFGREHAWLILGGLTLLGWIAARLLRQVF